MPTSSVDSDESNCTVSGASPVLGRACAAAIGAWLATAVTVNCRVSV